jgi:hypothetical protein
MVSETHLPDRSVLDVIIQCRMTKGASHEQIAALTETIGTELADDYVGLMSYSNGLEGPIGKENYLALWPVDRLVKATQEYRVAAKLPGLLLIGSDGGDTGYALDVSAPGTVVVELSLSQLDADPIRVVGRSISEFLCYLRDYRFDCPL